MFYIYFKENTNDIEASQWCQEANQHRKKKRISALTRNDLSENQTILSEIFFTEYNDELAINSINKYFSAFLWKVPDWGKKRLPSCL